MHVTTVIRMQISSEDCQSGTKAAIILKNNMCFTDCEILLHPLVEKKLFLNKTTYLYRFYETAAED